MATEVVMPKLGATMEEGTIVSWQVETGDFIEEGDIICEIQTDKTVLELEAETTGYLIKTLYDEGSVVKVHETIAFIGEEGEVINNTPSKKDIPETTVKEVAIQSKIRSTPAARRLARENNIELKNITGSGPLGRIQQRDVELYIAENSKKITPLAKKIAQEEGIDYNNIVGTGSRGKVVKADIVDHVSSIKTVEPSPDCKVGKRVPFTGIRKVIADRMLHSATSVPHVTLTTEVDMTNCIGMRKELLPVIEKMNGHRLSFNEIMIKATAHTLQYHPNMNVSLDEDEIIYHENIHIGFAVAVPDSLLVPVVKHANTLGLAAITAECKKLIKLAEEGKLRPDHMKNGTFTISNLGMYAVDAFNPIINPPESAILGVGRIREKPVGYQGEIVLRAMMTLSLSFDHRIIDGAPAAAFLTDLKDLLENPFKLIV